MTNAQLARFLVEELADGNIDRKIAVFANRLMLRLFSQPSFMSNLDNVVLFKPGAEGETNDQIKDGEFNEDDPDKEAEEEKNQDAEQDAMDDANETVVLQLSFNRLPKEVIAPLLRLIAAPRQPKLFRYTKDGFARMGIEIDLRPSDFPGDDYDYSF